MEPGTTVLLVICVVLLVLWLFSRSTLEETRTKHIHDIGEIQNHATESINAADKKAREAIDDANKKAQDIVDAALKKADVYNELATAAQEKAKEDAIIFADVIADFVRFKDEDAVPLSSVMDELEREYGFAKPGKALAAARRESKKIVKQNLAAICKDSDRKLRDEAVSLVVDVFNHYVDSIIEKTNYDNYTSSIHRIREAYETINARCRVLLNTSINKAYYQSRMKELKALNVVLVLRERDRAEQREIREQMRDEEKARREAEKILRETAKKKAEDERKDAELQARLDLALGPEKEKYAALLSEHRALMKENEDRRLQAKSLAEFTKRGHVYIISNIGSFGDDVLKIGMTRRLFPEERIDELGNASVPFPFDTHAMIRSEDAPKLEADFHTEFNEQRMNKVNMRKEFFKISLDDVRRFLVKEGIDPAEAKFTMRAEARQYNETRAIDALPNKQREKKLQRLLEEDTANIMNGDDNEMEDAEEMKDEEADGL